ncbi:MAG TPA: hypothetical protein VFW95_11770 [Candidatus Limnocylindria bacterium]|nr:hypothetical protein [Candidatus Limnocylindria bacterium]
MALPLSLTHRGRGRPSAQVRASLEAQTDLAEAEALLRRLLAAEDRIGLVYPLMDDARRFLARRGPHRSR